MSIGVQHAGVSVGWVLLFLVREVRLILVPTQEEGEGSGEQLCVRREASRGNDVHSLGVVPNAGKPVRKWCGK